VLVITTQSQAYSGVRFIELAGIPLAPTDVPVSNSKVTNDRQI